MTNVKTRVQRYRDSLRGQQCGRLDVWIGAEWILGARMIAGWQKRPLWQLVEDALKAYVAQHARITGPVKDRDR